jgi:hypothetical protein
MSAPVTAASVNMSNVFTICFFFIRGMCNVYH